MSRSSLQGIVGGLLVWGPWHRPWSSSWSRTFFWAQKPFPSTPSSPSSMTSDIHCRPAHPWISSWLASCRPASSPQGIAVWPGLLVAHTSCVPPFCLILLHSKSLILPSRSSSAKSCATTSAVCSLVSSFFSAVAFHGRAGSWWWC